MNRLQEEDWVTPSKNLQEISSLQLSSVPGFATNNIDNRHIQHASCRVKNYMNGTLLESFKLFGLGIG